MKNNDSQNLEEVELKIGDKIVKLPIKKSTIGPDVIDVTDIYALTGILRPRFYVYCLF